MKDIALLPKTAIKEKQKNKQTATEWLWLREVSLGGWMLMGLTLLLTASAFKSLRIPVGGLMLHLYMIPLIPLFILYAIPRFELFPKRILYSIGAFVFLFFLSVTVSDSSDTRLAMSEIFKVGSNVVTIFTCALMVRTKFDYRIAVIGFCIAAAILSLQNILAPGTTFGSEESVDTIGETIANKNAFSLYVLPLLLLGSYLVLDRTVAKILRIILLCTLFVTTIAIFASGNRSGWIGVLFIGCVILARGRSIKSVLLICVLAMGTYYALTKYVGTEIIERKIDQTSLDNESDETRYELIPTAFQVALDNPLFGVSPQDLPLELGRRLPDEAVLANETLLLDPHNVIAFILAGSGFPCFFAFLFLGWTLWERPKQWNVLSQISDAKDSHTLLRAMMFLWLLRGMFTREILYSPGFSIGLGLCIGFCISQGLWIPKAVDLYRLKLLMQKLRPLK
jgi:O-antigen ligase